MSSRPHRSVSSTPGIVLPHQDAPPEAVAPDAPSQMEEDLEARMSLQLLQRIKKLAGRMECHSSDILRAALHRFLETEEMRLGIASPPPASGALAKETPIRK